MYLMEEQYQEEKRALAQLIAHRIKQIKWQEEFWISPDRCVMWYEEKAYLYIRRSIGDVEKHLISFDFLMSIPLEDMLKIGKYFF